MKPDIVQQRVCSSIFTEVLRWEASKDIDSDEIEKHLDGSFREHLEDIGCTDAQIDTVIEGLKDVLSAVRNVDASLTDEVKKCRKNQSKEKSTE